MEIGPDMDCRQPLACPSPTVSPFDTVSLESCALWAAVFVWYCSWAVKLNFHSWADIGNNVQYSCLVLCLNNPFVPTPFSLSIECWDILTTKATTCSLLALAQTQPSKPSLPPTVTMATRPTNRARQLPSALMTSLWLIWWDAHFFVIFCILRCPSDICLRAIVHKSLKVCLNTCTWRHSVTAAWPRKTDHALKSPRLIPPEFLCPFQPRPRLSKCCDSEKRREKKTKSK